MFGDILQPTHLLFILIVALLVLGPKRLPEVGRALGNGLRDFKSAINGESKPDHEGIESEYHYDEPASIATSDSTGSHEVAGSEPKIGAQPAPSGEHEFAHEAQAAASVHEASATAGEHEFAHQQSQPAEHRAEPPA